MTRSSVVREVLSPLQRITWLKNELERRGRNTTKKAADAVCDNRILDEAQQVGGREPRTDHKNVHKGLKM